jgi:hypothetical protein
MNNCKRTMPSRSLLQGGVYVNAASTDIRARFKALQAEQRQSANVQQLRKRK